MIFRDDVRFARQKKQWCEGMPRSRPSRRMLPSRQSRSWWIWPGGKGWCFFVLHEFARAFFVSQPWPPAKDLWLGDNDDVYIMKTNGMFLSNPPRLKGQHEEGWLAIGCWKPQLFGIIFQNLLQMWFLRHKKLDWSSNALPVWCLRFGFVFFWTWWGRDTNNKNIKTYKKWWEKWKKSQSDDFHRIWSPGIVEYKSLLQGGPHHQFKMDL